MVVKADDDTNLPINRTNGIRAFIEVWGFVVVFCGSNRSPCCVLESFDFAMQVQLIR